MARETNLGILVVGALLYGSLAAARQREIERTDALVPVKQGARRAFTRRTRAGHERHQPAPGEHGAVPRKGPVFEQPDKAARRGRFAETPWEIPLRGWIHILRRTWAEMSQDHLGLIAAGVAFYALLAIFPALGVAVALAGLVTQPADFVNSLNQAAELFPAEAARILIDQATAVAGSHEGGLGLAAIVGLLLAMYSSSRGVMSLIEGLNVAYDEDEKRSFIGLNITALILTVIVIVGAIFGLTATIVIPAVLEIFGVREGWLAWVGTLRWPILLVGTMFGLSILYRFGPSRENAKWSWISPGAILACLMWLAGTWLFAWYAGNFASYNETFGTLGGAIVLLMWLWLSAYIVLIGAELNAEIEAQTSRDSTTGPEMPMGMRGAVKADTLGEPTE